MKRTLISLLTAALTLPGQKIETETPERGRVVRVQTALNHLTVIEVAEPVNTVAVGSPQAFKVERRENKVFIQPLQDGVATNLFIWTATTRLNYELVPATSDVGELDFAIDYKQPERQAELQPKPAPAQPATEVAIPIDMLLRGTSVKQVGFPRLRSRGVDVTIRDTYRKDDQVFIRYAIENRSGSAYTAATPRVLSLDSPRSNRSLVLLADVQLGSDYTSHLEGSSAAPVRIVRAEHPVLDIRPGATSVGVVVVELPKRTGSEEKNGGNTVLQMIFPADGRRQVVATLVL